MSLTNADDETRLSDIFLELHSQCLRATPSSLFSSELIHDLSCLTPDVRRELVNRVHGDCSPLFWASFQGNVEMVEYLITKCGADVELRGICEMGKDRTHHSVTPLWCAAISGKLEVVKCLVKHGANIDSIFDTGFMAIHSECYMTYIEIVEFLITNGANISRPNISGGTCLINFVPCPKLCQYLLDRCVEVNICDAQGKTALHHAIQSQYLDSALLLLKRGADVTIKSKHGNDALQLACLKMATPIVIYLLAHYNYSDERIAEAHELLGATFLDSRLDLQTTLSCWKKALAIRNKNPDNLIVKRKVPPKPAYSFSTEFDTLEELENLSLDMDAIKTQSLLIFERILGPFHEDFISMLFLRAASYADSHQYQLAIDVWKYALSLKIEKDTILDNEICHSFDGLVRLFFKTPNFNSKDWPHFDDVVETFCLVVANIPSAMKLLTIGSVCQKQESFDKCLKSIAHLIHIMKFKAKDSSQYSVMHQLIVELFKIDPVFMKQQKYFAKFSTESEVFQKIMDCARSFSSTIYTLFAAMHNIIVQPAHTLKRGLNYIYETIFPRRLLT